MLNVKFLGIAAIAVTGMSLSIGSTDPAEAACLSTDCKTVTYQGANYDVSKLTGTFNNLQSTLTQSVWWGSSSAASTFAALVGGDLGFPNTGTNFSFGPLFAFNTPEAIGLYAYGSVIGSNSTLFGPFFAGNNSTQTYAVANPSSVSVPEPSTGFGYATALIIGVMLKRKFSRVSHL